MKISIPTRLISFLTIVLLLINFSFALLIVWPADVIDLKKLELIGNGKIYAGDVVWYRLTYDKKKDLPCSVSKQLVNKIIITFPAEFSNMPIGSRDMIQSIQIPKSIEPGLHKLRGSLTYRINFLREKTYTIETSPFMVYER